MKTCRLVVARFNENTSWLRLVRKPWKPVIVQKGKDLPNEGREASSYLWAMQQFYDDDGYIAFVQGDPYAHAVVHNILRPVTRFTWMGDSRYLSEEDGSPWHPGLPVREKHEQWIGPWPGPIKFAAGAQFIVPAELIRTHPKEKYAELQEQMSEGENPWVMERLWQRLFEGVSTNQRTIPHAAPDADPSASTA